MNYKLLFIIIIVLSIGAISGYFVFKSTDVQTIENIHIDITKSNKITNISIEDFNKLKSKANELKDLTIFYFYSDCPHFTEDVLIRDVKNNYYYLPEKNAAIFIYGDYEWTKDSKDIQYHMFTVNRI